MTKRAEIDAETLMAYADGELPPLEAKRVERAIAADPDLARQVDDHRRLRAMLANGFATIMDQPVPDKLSAMLQSRPVVDLASVRAARAANQPRPQNWSRRWGAGMAIAASLAIGMVIGQRIETGPVESRGGALIASGGLAQALDTQLASAQGGTASLKMLVTFRDQQGTICRSFSGATLSGIACRDGSEWQLRETRGGVGGSNTQYQQAGSADAKLMADAQTLMAGDPLDAAAEAKAKAGGWR